MRIVQVVHNFLGEERGGTELYTEELAGALADRHDVAVFTARVEAGGDLRIEETRRDGVEVACVSVPPSASLRERWSVQREVARRFGAWLSRRRPDVVHVQHAIDVSPAVLSVPGAAGVPSVVSLHDFWYLCPRTFLVRKDLSACHTGPRGGVACIAHCRPAGDRHDYAVRPQPPPRPADLAFVARALRHRRLLRAVTRFVAPSRFTREAYAALGLERSRIDVLPWGMRALARPPRAPARLPVRFAFLGYVSAVKGADLAVEAFRAVDPARATLTLHGPIARPERERFRGLLDAAPAVRWGGPYARADLAAVLGGADVVVVPSRARETFSRVVHEAFQLGLPVVASSAGALPEQVRDGVDGLVFEDAAGLAGAVARLTGDPALVDRLRDGISGVKDTQTHAREIEDVYGRLTAG